MAKGCICGKPEACERWHHPDTWSTRRLADGEIVEHLQRRPGETFAEMRERLAKQ